MSILTRLFGQSLPRGRAKPLYQAIVSHGRDRHWYLEGAVPDSQDGRFDMIVAIFSLVLFRLEQDGDTYAPESAALAELFIDDMDGQLRELGMGDVVVGKHIGKMMGAFGGRLTVYRAGFDGSDRSRDALARNLYRGDPPGEEALAYVEARLARFARALDTWDGGALLAGTLPELT
jgi:cytochrome b pre-mRNA-processing protein 3